MTTLLIKHLPLCLSEAALKEFFAHFGAQEMRLLQGKMASETNSITRILFNVFSYRSIYILF
jgi:hypothetical protein